MKAFRAKCPHCGVVFEEPWHPTLVHTLDKKLLKCPACGKEAMMDVRCTDPVTWPAGDAAAPEGASDKMRP